MRHVTVAALRRVSRCYRVYGTVCFAVVATVIPVHGTLAQTTPVPLPGPVPAVSATSVAGVIRSAADSSAVVGAELRGKEHQLLGRTDQDGRFVIRVDSGGIVTVRALGFRMQRIVVSSTTRVVYLETAATALPVMITTAGQREMRLAEATQSVTVVTREQIDGAAAIAANQLLRNLPGLQELPAPPSKTSMAIRGLDESRVLVLVDGEPTAGALIDNRDIGRLSTVAVQRIEVTKGPSSVEFGSDALGGVINLVTAPPSETRTIDATVRGGGLGRRESTVGFSDTFGALGVRVDGGWRQVDRVTGFNNVGATLDRVYDGRSDMRYQVNSNTQLRLNGQGARERQRWPVGGGYNGFIDNRSAQGLAEVEQRLGGGTLRVRGFAQQFRYQYRQAASEIPIAGSADSLEQQEQVKRALVSYARDVQRHRIDIGAQYSSRHIRSPGKVDGDSASDRVLEAFARDAIHVGALLVTGGVRTSNSSLWGSAVNPSVGVAWDAGPTVRVRGSLARGFRAPSFKEIRYTFLNAGGGYTIVGNDALLPESSWSSSAALAYAPSAHFSMDVEVFHNTVSNLIDTRLQGLGSDGYLRYQNVNVADAVTRGVETSVRWSFDSHRVLAGYTLLDAQNRETQMTLSRRSRHTARVALASEWPQVRGLSTDASVRYSSRAPVIGATESGEPVISQYQGAFVSIDGQVRYVLTDMVEASVGANNLLNQRPALFSPAYSRQWYVGARLHWLP